MPKKIIWNNRAKNELRAIDQPTAMRILDTVARFCRTNEGDVKRLQGVEPPEFRLRVGDYRVLFHSSGDVLEVTGVKHRREAYR
jgi:mRNA-degrading endonuclease RelE of RelBE toxin-antitoxin system